MRPFRITAGIALLAAVAAACGTRATDTPARASGYVEATDVRVASKIGGRIAAVKRSSSSTSGRKCSNGIRRTARASSRSTARTSST